MSFINGYAVVSKDYDNQASQVGIIDTKGTVEVPVGLYKNLSNVTETGLIWATDQEGYLNILKVTPHPSGLTMPAAQAASGTPAAAPATPVQTPAATGFIDVPAYAYYAEAVRWAVDQGITSGSGANSFSPGPNCSNA